jgi:hypothetical protein
MHQFGNEIGQSLTRALGIVPLDGDCLSFHPAELAERPQKG